MQIHLLIITTACLLLLMLIQTGLQQRVIRFPPYIGESACLGIAIIIKGNMFAAGAELFYGSSLMSDNIYNLIRLAILRTSAWILNILPWNRYSLLAFELFKYLKMFSFVKD